MRNDITAPEPDAESVQVLPVDGVSAPAPVRPSPLVILAADDDAVCVDDLCLPADTPE